MKTIQKRRISAVTHQAIPSTSLEPMQQQIVKNPVFEKNELLDAGHEVIKIKDVFPNGHPKAKTDSHYYLIESDNQDLLLSESELQQRLALMIFSL